MPASARTVAELAEIAGGDLILPPGPVPEVTVTDVTHDSRQSALETLFVAIRGERADGHAFVPEAIAAGSPAVCVDHALGSVVPEVVVADTRAALGPMSASVHGNPSHTVPVVGVTGTNGKTTVTHYVESITAGSGRTTGLIGTIETRIGGQTLTNVRTTPEASDFQRLLAHMRDEGAEVVAAEVSSHALELGRVASTKFAVAAFTNLSQDHLDFHHDMESYLEAKQRLFTEYEVGTGVINLDDPAGPVIASRATGDVLTFGSDGCDVSVAEIVTVGDHTTFTLSTPWGEERVQAPVLGDFNVSNAGVAAACCLAVGVSFDDVLRGLEALAPVPGRFEIVSGDHPVRVIVDYAHTPDGVSKAISAARLLTRQRVIVVVGAGGDRDRDKRALMGASASLGDVAIITSDNPRSEDPDSIVDEVLAGVLPTAEAVREPDRRTAIRLGLEKAGAGDVVLILGRGHEPTQEMAGENRPFDDREVAQTALATVGRSADPAGDSGSMGL